MKYIRTFSLLCLIHASIAFADRESELTLSTNQSASVLPNCKAVDHLLLSQKERSDGRVEVSAQGQGAIFFTTDGTFPRVNAGSPQGTTQRYEQAFVLAWPTLVRAILQPSEGSAQPAERSLQITPRVWTWDIGLASLPKPYLEKKIKGLYVTGNFRNWNAEWDERYRLKETANGFRGIIPIEIKGALEYKFTVRLEDDSTGWFYDEARPTTGSGPYTNNVIDPLQQIAKSLKAEQDGFIEESVIDRTHLFSSSVDSATKALRIRVNLLDGDAEQVSLRLANGATLPLRQGPVWHDGLLRFRSWTGRIILPTQSLNTTSWITITDAKKTYAIGASLVEEITDSNCIPASTFVFSFDSKRQTLNEKPLIDTPAWAIDSTWYQIFPDRFRNGDTSNDVPPDYGIGMGAATETLRKLPSKVSLWNSPWFSMTTNEKKVRDQIFTFLTEERRRKNPLCRERENQCKGKEQSESCADYAKVCLVRDIDASGYIYFNRSYGGDLRGIKEKISWLKALGVNAVYLNPVFDSDSNHRYDTKQYHHVDPRLGPMKRTGKTTPTLSQRDANILSKEDFTNPATWGYTSADLEFMRLVEALHKENIRIVIDGVFNHAAGNSALMADIARHGKQSKYYEWFDSSYEGDPDYQRRACSLADFFPDTKQFPYASKVRYDAWWSFCRHPNHREGFADGSVHPGFKKYTFDVLERWFLPKKVDGINYPGIDGIRLDVYREVSDNYWRQFRAKVKSLKSDALIVAEDWGGGFDLFDGTTVDSMMNYSFRDFIERWFVNNNPEDKYTPEEASDFINMWQGKHREEIRHGLWNMLDSHDTDRLLSKMMPDNRDLSRKKNYWGSEQVSRPDKGAPYTNDKPDRAVRNAFLSIVAFQMASPGAPIIYYGDEIGMWGSGDPTCRKPMIWPDASKGQKENRCTPKEGSFCTEDRDTQFTIEQDTTMLATYKRLIDARKRLPVLRRGSINTELTIEIEKQSFKIGDKKQNAMMLWGFERNNANDAPAYFMSNTNPDLAEQSFVLQTKFKQDQKVLDLVTNQFKKVGPNGELALTLPRDGAALLVTTPQ